MNKLFGQVVLLLTILLTTECVLIGKQFSCIQNQDLVIRLRPTTSEVLQRFAHMKWPNREDRLTGLTELLRSNSEVSSRRLVKFLKNQNIPSSNIKSLWISNVVSISNADCSKIENLQTTFDEIISMSSTQNFHQEDFEKTLTAEVHQRSSDLISNWALGRMKVYDAWDYPGNNTKGEGIVVGSIDGGVEHYQLVRSHRTTYGWYDSYSQSLTVVDESGRGTHSIGNVVVNNDDYDIGVAPGAQWIACKACGRSLCSEVALLECGQWMACPTLENGTEPDCTKAPHIILNAWTAGQDNDFYDDVLQTWLALDIVAVAGTGNFGPSCQTVTSPGDRPGIITVGFTTEEDKLHYMSSKGPSSEKLTPLITAPGTNIFSTVAAHDNIVGASATGSHSGVAHVAGIAALLKARDNTLTVAEIERLIVDGVVTSPPLIGTGYNCGGVNERTFPNHAFGYGRVHALNSVILVEEAIAKKVNKNKF